MPNHLPHGLLALVLFGSACVGSAGLSLGGSGTTGPAPHSGPATGGRGAAGGGTVGGAGPTPPSAAEHVRLSDFAFEVKESTGDYSAAWVIDKLTTFEVAPACYEKMLDRNANGAVHTATFYVRDVAGFAKLITGDDWPAIESQNNNDRERNRKLIEPMIDGFKGTFHLTIHVEGDDCDASRSALWLKYWGEVSSVLRDYPPASGKLFVRLVASASAKDVSVTADDATSTFTIVAPRDIEKSGWSDRMTKPFRKRARAR